MNTTMVCGWVKIDSHSSCLRKFVVWSYSGRLSIRASHRQVQWLRYLERVSDVLIKVAHRPSLWGVQSLGGSACSAADKEVHTPQTVGRDSALERRKLSWTCATLARSQRALHLVVIQARGEEHSRRLCSAMQSGWGVRKDTLK